MEESNLPVWSPDGKYLYYISCEEFNQDIESIKYDLLRIEFNQENLSYSLFNVQGQLLASKQVNNATTTIGMQFYAPAIYFLKVTSNNQAIKTFKIIKN